MDPFEDVFPIENRDIPASYVSLPEGNSPLNRRRREQILLGKMSLRSPRNFHAKAWRRSCLKQIATAVPRDVGSDFYLDVLLEVSNWVIVITPI